MTYNKLIDLLRRLHEVFPTDKQRHNITLELEDEILLLTIFYNGMWYRYTFEDGDLDDTEQAIKELKGLVADEVSQTTKSN